MRDVAHVQDLGTMETLMGILAERSSHQLVYAALANEINVSVDTVKRWIDILGRLQYGFTIRPWFRNVTKALRKEPRWFLRDWSGVADPGDRAGPYAAEPATVSRRRARRSRAIDRAGPRDPRSVMRAASTRA